jgi:hypothetical protein
MERPRGSWEGGYLHEGVYYIRRQVNGRRFDVSTRATTRKAALRQLGRFEEAPQQYDPLGPSVGDPIYLDENLAAEYLRWCLDPVDGKKNSAPWVRKKQGYLDWWAEKLDGLDLRRISLGDHIMPALAGIPARAHRTATLKGLYTWLRTAVHRISGADDPTFGALQVPQAPERLTDKSFPREHHQQMSVHLDEYWRDVAVLQVGTGWHLTEVQRFIAGIKKKRRAPGGGVVEETQRGSIEAVSLQQRSDDVAGVVVCPLHKIVRKLPDQDSNLGHGD